MSMLILHNYAFVNDVETKKIKKKKVGQNIFSGQRERVNDGAYRRREGTISRKRRLTDRPARTASDSAISIREQPSGYCLYGYYNFGIFYALFQYLFLFIPHKSVTRQKIPAVA